MKIEKYDMVVIGGSAGSLKLIEEVLNKIPQTTHLSIIIVLHRMFSAKNYLIKELNEISSIIVEEAEEKAKIKKGRAYIAPPDYHLLIEEDKTFSLDYSEKIRYSRPSINVTFESVADVYKNKAIAILLSGANDDGANGIEAIKANGGLTIVQDPELAEYKVMPLTAIQQTDVDYVYNNNEIVNCLM